MYRTSTEVHDVVVNGREVQIKIFQQDNIIINHQPDYLIALYLTKKGDVYEVYNNPGKEPWESARKRNNHNNRHMRVNILMTLDEYVPSEQRIKQVNLIEKVRLEYKNKNSISP